MKKVLLTTHTGSNPLRVSPPKNTIVLLLPKKTAELLWSSPVKNLFRANPMHLLSHRVVSELLSKQGVILRGTPHLSPLSKTVYFVFLLLSAPTVARLLIKRPPYSGQWRQLINRPYVYLNFSVIMKLFR